MQALALLGKNHTTEERGEEFVLFFILHKGMKLVERCLDIAIAINRGKQKLENNNQPKNDASDSDERNAA